MGSLSRSENLERLRGEAVWDVVVIGAGATGLGSAVDAAARGYRTLLLESNDFAHGTSSRSTKLIHGGVRYLARGNVVLGARGTPGLRYSAPQRTFHLVHPRDFVVPAYHWHELPYYATGLKLYDVLAGRLRLRLVALAFPVRGSGPEFRRFAARDCAEGSSTPTDSSTMPGWRSPWRGLLPTWAARSSITCP